MVEVGQTYRHSGNDHLYIVLGIGRHATNSEESDQTYVYYMNEQGDMFDREVTEFCGLNDNGVPRFVPVAGKYWNGKELTICINLK